MFFKASFTASARLLGNGHMDHTRAMGVEGFRVLSVYEWWNVEVAVSPL